MNFNNSKSIVVLGSGGHSKVLIETLKKMGEKLLGITSLDLKKGNSFCGLQIIGNDKDLLRYSPKEIMLVNGVGSLSKRLYLAKKMRSQGFEFARVVHPSALIPEDVELPNGIQVMAGVVIQPGVKIGQDTIINTGVIIDHDCNIGQQCHLAPGVVLSGGVKIGEAVHVGTGSTVIQDIVIGKESMIAAGSVVFKNLEDYSKLIQKK